MIVVDASVAVKWFLPEAGDTAAQRLLESGESLIGPFLIRVEVAAALAKKARVKEIEPSDAKAAVKLWIQAVRDGVITLVSEEMDLSRAFGMALELNHPLQDCVYLALAERLGATLLTADEKFLAKAHPSHPALRALVTIDF